MDKMSHRVSNTASLKFLPEVGNTLDSLLNYRSNPRQPGDRGFDPQQLQDTPSLISFTFSVLATSLSGAFISNDRHPARAFRTWMLSASTLLQFLMASAIGWDKEIA